MKVVFTHGYFIQEDEKEQAIMRPYPPLGILYLSAWLEKHGKVNSVFDTTFSRKQLIKDYLLEDKPDILAIYTNLMTKLNVIEIMQFVKKQLPKTTVVIGGPDVRHNIEDYLNAGAQIAVIGEGEQTMLDIVNTVESGNTSEFGHIPGIAYFSGTTLVKTQERSKIKSVDDLPIPNRKMIDIQAYLDTWKKHHGQSAMTVSTQRGCPYTCKWCSTAVYGQSYRRRSAALVAQELKYLKETYNPDTVWFVDDVFTVSHKWLAAFADEVNKQDAIIPFECITRADRMNEDVIQTLKRAGAFRIWIGAESGSQKVIDLMDRRVDVNQVRKMIQRTRANEMEAGTFIMLGYPGETQEDIKETVRHLKESNPNYFTITVAYPIKGTSLYQEVEAKQTKALNWMETTDRDRDFERHYSRKYYDYAVRWVENSVRAFQKKSEKGILSASFLKHKTKAWLMYLSMQFSK